MGLALGPMKASRRSFVQGSIGVCSFGLLSAACGSSNDGNAGGGGVCSVTISANHGHVLDISAADKMAAAAKDYDIRGSATHSHTVSLSANDFASLNSGNTVNVTSSVSEGHSHDLSIKC
jgi:hypothetical protein